MIIYEACYNPMTYESSFGTLSLYRTKEGAQKVIDAHKAEKLAEFEKLYSDEEWLPFTFGEFEAWEIFETDLLD